MPANYTEIEKRLWEAVEVESEMLAERFPEGAYQDVGRRWQTVALGKLAEFRNGINYNKDNFGHGIKVINVNKDIWESVTHSAFTIKLRFTSNRVLPNRKNSRLTQYS